MYYILHTKKGGWESCHILCFNDIIVKLGCRHPWSRGNIVFSDTKIKSVYVIYVLNTTRHLVYFEISHFCRRSVKLYTEGQLEVAICLWKSHSTLLIAIALLEGAYIRHRA